MRHSHTSDPLRIALAHDWLTGMRGGEAVLERLCVRYPTAPLLTLFHRPGSVSSLIEQRTIVTSALDRLPGARARYQHLLPLYPAAIESFDTRRYDLIVSTSHCAIKALRVRRDAQHVCYVHTPMRYIYDQFAHYFGVGQASASARVAMGLLRPVLQRWDRATAQRPTTVLANSMTVRERIQRYWDRDARVVYPPVDLQRFRPVPTEQRGDHYLVVSALVPYKRVELAIQACLALGRELHIIGDGVQLTSLQQRYVNDNIRFFGRQDGPSVARAYASARALLFPGEEDFGITPVEAQASGTPVIAYAAGGATETVIDVDRPQATGVLFSPQTTQGLVDAIRRFEARAAELRIEDLLQNTRRFSIERFDEELAGVLDVAEERALAARAAGAQR